jgi:hypothetical protein
VIQRRAEGWKPGRVAPAPAPRYGLLASLLLLPLPAFLAACGPSQNNTDVRMWTDSLAFRISTEPLPPRARERVLYRVIVRDKESGAPIEGGEGRIFAMNRDSTQIWDGLEPGPELGTYYATLNFITAGEWAIGLQFRKDSTRAIERMDWMQDVRAAR